MRQGILGVDFREIYRVPTGIFDEVKGFGWDYLTSKHVRAHKASYFCAVEPGKEHNLPLTYLNT